MNGKDLLDSMSYVDDDLIEKTEVRPAPSALSTRQAEKQRRRKIWSGIGIGLCAAAIAFIGFAAWKSNGFGLFSSETDATTTPYKPTTTAPWTETSTLPTSEDVTTTTLDYTTDSSWPDDSTRPSIPTEDTVPSEIFYYPLPDIDTESAQYSPDKASGEVPNESIGAVPGDILLPPSLEEMAAMPDHKEDYFVVSIQVCHFAFIDEFIASYEEQYRAGTIPEEDYAFYTSFDYLSQIYDDEIFNAIQEEINRLRLLGYHLELEDSTRVGCDEYYRVFLKGYLTGEELSTFKNDTSYGYRITWLAE